MGHLPAGRAERSSPGACPRGAAATSRATRSASSGNFAPEIKYYYLVRDILSCSYHIMSHFFALGIKIFLEPEMVVGGVSQNLASRVASLP